MGPGGSGRDYSRVRGAATAFRPVAVGVGGAERGAPMSQGAYRRVCGAATPKGAARRGCSATGPTPRATGSPAHVRVIPRTGPAHAISIRALFARTRSDGSGSFKVIFE